MSLANDIDLINFEHFLSMDLKILMSSEFFFHGLSKLFQTTGPLKNKDCLPNSGIFFIHFYFITSSFGLFQVKHKRQPVISLRFYNIEHFNGDPFLYIKPKSCQFTFPKT